MKKIVIDGEKIDNREMLFASLKEQLQSEGFQGNNLDALYDALTGLGQAAELEVRNPGALYEKLGSYANRLVRVFLDAEEYREQA